MTLARRSLRTWITLIVLLLCFVLVIADRTGLNAGWNTLWGSAGDATNTLYGWAVVLGAVVVLLGAFNLIWVHVLRIQHGQSGWWQSLLLVVALIGVLIAGVINPSGDRSPLVEWTFDSVLAPGYGALFALLVFFTAAAIYAQVHVRSKSGRWVLIGVVATMLVQTPAARAILPANFSNAALWFADVPLTATLRGALIGIGLALVIVAVRYIVGRRA